MGHYLQPTSRHFPIARLVPPEEFARIEVMARAKGFLAVAASPMTRSSFHADVGFAALQGARRADNNERDNVHV